MPDAVIFAGNILVIDNPVVAYDPVADAWTTRQAPSPAGAIGINAAAAVNGKIYVFNPDQTLVYDPAAETP
jgi:N-acetylneuraminic acid mutarotase